MFKLIKDVKLRKGLKGFIIKLDNDGVYAPEIAHCEVACHDGFVNKLENRFSSNYSIESEDIFESMRDFKRLIKPLIKERNKIINKKKRSVYKLTKKP